MRSLTGKRENQKEFRQRLIVSVITMAVILALTVFVLAKVSSTGEEHAFLDIKAAAEFSDSRMVALVDDTFRSLNSIASLFISRSAETDLTEAATGIAGVSIGPLNMKTRLYFPDGRVLTENGLYEDASFFVNYAVTLNAMKSGRYISCVKYDYLDPSVRVIEFFAPVKKGGRTVALISAVMDLDTLPGYMATSSFDGQASVLFLDARDGVFFLDTFHGNVTGINEYSGRKDKDGNSVIPFLENMMSGQETFSTLVSQSTGRILYLYAVPSQIEGWSSVISVDEEIAFAESISDSRLLIMLAGAEVLICLIYIIWMFRSAKRQALSGSRDLLNRMAGEDGLFLIDCAADTRRTIHNHCAGAENYSDDESYSESIEKYVTNYVAEPDREMMRKVTSKEYIMERLKTDREYTVEYRDTSTSIQRFCKMRIVRYSDREALQSFTEKDREIIDQRIFKKLEADYFALFTVDLDAGMLQVLKQGPWQGAGAVGDIEPFTPAARRLADTFTGDDRAFFDKLSDINYIRHRFETEDKASHIYQTHFQADAKWGNAIGFVLARRKDGTPSFLAACFSLLDKDQGEKADLQLKLESSMHVVGGLASEYAELYHVDIDSGRYTQYQFTETIDEGKLLSHKYPSFTDLVEAFSKSDLVHQDHRVSLREFYGSAASLKRALQDKKKITMRFLRNCNGEYLWYEVNVIKCEDAREEAHSVIVGIIEKDAEVRREAEIQRQKKEAEESGRLANSISSVYNIVYIINMADDSLEVRRMDESMLEKNEQFRSFTEASEYTLTRVIHPRDRERMRKELDRDFIRQRLSGTPSYDVTYCIIKDGTTRWGKMNITAFGEDKIILAMAEKDIEIPKHNMAEMRYEEYFALFFVDIDTGMMREIRNSSGYRFAEEGTSAPYEPRMKEYASTLSGETRDFFMKLSDLNYIKRDLGSDMKRTYNFKSALSDAWVEAISYVIERHDDGTPAMFSLGFVYVDSLSAGRQELQSRMKADMEMIGCLASGYSSLFHMDLDAGILTAYSLDGRKLPKPELLVGEDGDMFALLQKYAGSERVYPEDRHLFEEMNADAIRERLAHKKSFVMSFRQKVGEEYLWHQMSVVKSEDAEERANNVAVGFSSRESAVRKESDGSQIK